MHRLAPSVSGHDTDRNWPLGNLAGHRFYFLGPFFLAFSHRFKRASFGLTGWAGRRSGVF